MGDELHRFDFGCTGHGAGGEGGGEEVEHIFVFTDDRFDIGDHVHDVAVALYTHHISHFHSTGFGDSTDIIASKVDEHEVLRTLLGVVEHLLFELFVPCMGLAAFTGAGDGTQEYLPICESYHDLWAGAANGKIFIVE